MDSTKNIIYFVLGIIYSSLIWAGIIFIDSWGFIPLIIASVVAILAIIGAIQYILDN